MNKDIFSYFEGPNPPEEEGFLPEGPILREIFEQLQAEGVIGTQNLLSEAQRRLSETGINLSTYDDPEGGRASFVFEPSTGRLVSFQGIFLGIDADLDGEDLLPFCVFSSDGLVIFEHPPGEPRQPQLFLPD